MGQEIEQTHFNHSDFHRFEKALRAETALLQQWHEAGRFSDGDCVGGFELEAWLVDARYRPAPLNDALIARLDRAFVAPELAKFNIEFNSQPRTLRGDVLAEMERELTRSWREASAAAAALDAQLLAIGILPTVRPADLVTANMSEMKRYRALNEQILRLRQGQPLQIDIQGRDHLQLTHHDVMLESAATSFQLHLQVPPAEAARYYNASKILSAPIIAASANSPYLFGHDLWDESRIPLFEQAVAVVPDHPSARALHERVTFGDRFLRRSLLECFAQNLAQYDILLPLHFDAPPERLAHLRLHNGTIWRWNRPLIGFDQQQRPHLRIEHRVMPAGPTIVDTLANTALYYGLVRALARQTVAPESRIDFATARTNFYAAARAGLRAEIRWLDGQRGSVRDLLLEQLLPQARSGLDDLGITPEHATHFLDIIEQRVRSGQNGAAWQRAFIAAHGADMPAMTRRYHELQQDGRPVSQWAV